MFIAFALYHNSKTNKKIQHKQLNVEFFPSKGFNSIKLKTFLLPLSFEIKIYF